MWLVSALALLFSSCSSEAANNGSEVSACEILLGRIHDGGLNAKVHEGFRRAEKELAVEPRVQAGYGANIETATRNECDAVVAVGYRLADPTLETARAHPELKFVVVDYWFDFSSAQELERKNVALLAYRTDEAAFLAGYLAAGMSESGIVGTFGGHDDPATRTVMNGFKAGEPDHKRGPGGGVRYSSGQPVHRSPARVPDVRAVRIRTRPRGAVPKGNLSLNEGSTVMNSRRWRYKCTDRPAQARKPRVR